MHPTPDRPGPDQESVWAYPRPAIAEPTRRHIRIVHAGIVLADSTGCFRTLETSHPPSYYIPPADIATEHLRASARRSMCEWKGVASYVDVVLPGVVLRDVGWRYATPTPSFAGLAGFVAFYAAPFDSVTVDGEAVIPQPGGFYGGWITSREAGPFKGGPGSTFW